MSLWKRIEQTFWTGRVLKEYGPLSEGRYGAGKRTVQVLLSHREGRDRFIIKVSDKSLFSASVQYIDLDREGALKLQVALEDALGQMR